MARPGHQMPTATSRIEQGSSYCSPANQGELPRPTKRCETNLEALKCSAFIQSFQGAKGGLRVRTVIGVCQWQCGASPRREGQVATAL